MSIVSQIVFDIIYSYDKEKTGKWEKPEPPPLNTFDRGELYIIGRSIISRVEGLLSDKLLEKEKE